MVCYRTVPSRSLCEARRDGASIAKSSALEIRNPKDARGYRKAAHHQFFTEDIGHPKLAQHLYGILGLMRIADEQGEVAAVWDNFMRMVDRAYPRRGDTLQLSLFQDDTDYAIFHGHVAVGK